MTSIMNIRITCQDTINQLQEVYEEGRLMTTQEEEEEYYIITYNHGWVEGR